MSQSPAGTYLRPWSVISQSVTWAPTPEYAADRGMECGEACIVMILKYCTGVWTSAAYLDHLINDLPGNNIGTSLDQMVSVLALMETDAAIEDPGSIASARILIEAEINQGHPLIALRYWDRPGNSLLHYTCVTGYGDGTIEQAGPGYGVMFTETDDGFWSMYAGALILVHRKRRLGHR